GEKNDAKLTWGDASNTEWSETVTKTYQFEILKYAATDTNKNPLAGATFQLKDASGNVVKLVKVSDTEYRVANGSETGAVESFTTVASGKIVIKGVDLDKYTLVETAAPAGYNTLKDPVEVTVLATNALTVEVPNASGTELPSTGGMGTTIFYVLGSVLVLGAVVLLVTKKRMSTNG
ncbi:MAG: prealbumin-like fold domain-containing protein, partial [Clostridiales bacterium]|nr:prealbumin-like fold domain-containing protein [Clostridiales bacterium]